MDGSGSSDRLPPTLVSPVLAYDVVVLAGGSGERLGGTDKALLEVGGVSLLTRILRATAAAHRIVVVGPRRPGTTGVLWTTEDPPGGGPVAGIVAGLEALDTSGSTAPWVLVLAVDHPGVASLLPALLQSAHTAITETDTVCPFDHDGNPVWLLAAYRRDSLRHACRKVGTGHGVSVGRLVGGLRFDPSEAREEQIGDIDTWADHRSWTNRMRM